MADISKDAVERLAKFHDASAKLYNDPEESGLLACAVTTAATLRAQAAEIERLRSDLIAFCGPWAATYARDHGLPDRHLHPTHYDILKNAGARMDDFVRAEAGAPHA